MDTTKQDQYIQKIEEFVLDEDKIVTCSVLANDLKVSLQDSKELLSKFVANQLEKDPQGLSVTYILQGILKDSNLPSVCLVKDHELKDKRAQFAKVTSEVIYSVQKSNNVDFNILALVEKIDPDTPRESCLLGSVVSKNCVKRILKTKKLPSPQKPVVKQKPSFFTKTEPKKENVDSNAATSKDIPNKPKQEPKGKSKGHIANFFTKGAQKAVENKPQVSDTAQSSKTDEAKKLSNEIKTEVKSETVEDKCDKTQKSQAVEEKMEVDDDSDKEVAPVNNKTTTTSTKKNKKKRPNKENGDQPAKKRKRIIQRNDSDSDDIFGDDEDHNDEIVEKSFEEEPEPPPKVQKPLAPRNKVKKAVDRTYEDEDGFIVTRTEYVYETPSEDEVEEAKMPEKTTPKPIPKPAADEKKSSSPSENESPKNAKGSRGKKAKKAPPANQPSIMNFFKKK